MSSDNKKFGKKGEERAADYLIDRGFSIIARNFRYGRLGEIDIIAGRDNLVLFVEVKTRKSDRFGGALHSLNAKKINVIKKTAQYFLLKSPQFNSPGIICRFDLIAIEDGIISWHEDAFR